MPLYESRVDVTENKGRFKWALTCNKDPRLQMVFKLKYLLCHWMFCKMSTEHMFHMSCPCELFLQYQLSRLMFCVPEQPEHLGEVKETLSFWFNNGEAASWSTHQHSISIPNQKSFPHLPQNLSSSRPKLVVCLKQYTSGLDWTPKSQVKCITAASPMFENNITTQHNPRSDFVSRKIFPAKQISSMHYKCHFYRPIYNSIYCRGVFPATANSSICIPVWSGLQTPMSCLMYKPGVNNS